MLVVASLRYRHRERLVLKRGAGAFSLGDLLMNVLLADAAQNAISANYTSVTEGIILVMTQ